MQMDSNVLFSTALPGVFDASYQKLAGGSPIVTTVLLDQDVEVFPGGFESNVAEHRVEMVVRYDHIGSVARGDTVTIGSDVYDVEDELLNDRTKIRVTVKLQ